MIDWSEVLETHGGLVWTVVRRLVDQDHDAAECFQATFVSAWEVSRRQSISNWPALLKRIATARAIDHLQARLRHAARLRPFEAVDQFASPTGPPSAVAEENELCDLLLDALATMPAEQAKVCCLRFLESMTYEQIAEQLGMTVNHVGVLLHRGRALLQLKLSALAPAAHNRTENQP
jgi:RNA polymerase sigma-70 factor (ECF subfamily)